MLKLFFILLHFISFIRKIVNCASTSGKKIQNTNPRCLWPKLLQLRPLATQSGGAVTPQWSCSVHLGPFRSISLKQGLAGGNSWHRFMEAVGEKGRGRRTGLVMASFFPPPSPTLWTEPPGSVVANGTDWRHFKRCSGIKLPWLFPALHPAEVFNESVERNSSHVRPRNQDRLWHKWSLCRRMVKCRLTSENPRLWSPVKLCTRATWTF